MIEPALNILTAIDVQQASADAARKRRAQALELKDSGLTHRQIGGILGVTRQRVSVMLKQARKDKSVKR